MTILTGRKKPHNLFQPASLAVAFSTLNGTLPERMTQVTARDFPSDFIADCPFGIHTVLTDNGAQFTYALLAEHLRPKTKTHMFDQTCARHGIKHKLTKFRHPWTNGQVEIMNRKIKARTTKNYH